MVENLKYKYIRGFIRIDQLEKYVELGIISKEELELILNS